MQESEKMVIICRQPNCSNSKIAEYSIDDIKNVHWSNQSGGINKITKKYYLYGYIPYEDAKRLLDCSGLHDFGYNEAKVCIVKSKNKQAIHLKNYYKLIEHALCNATSKFQEDICQREILKYNNRNKKSAMIKSLTCKETILKVLEDNKNEIRRKDLINAVGFQLSTFRKSLKALVDEGLVILEGSNNSPCQIIRIGRAYNKE